jgi:hypothetical protein
MVELLAASSAVIVCASLRGAWWRLVCWYGSGAFRVSWWLLGVCWRGRPGAGILPACVAGRAAAGLGVGVSLTFAGLPSPASRRCEAWRRSSFGLACVIGGSVSA